MRLNKTPTLSSARREVYSFDPMAPRDSLDFVIKATYDQHGEFLCGPADVKVQRETSGNPDGYVSASGSAYHVLYVTRILYINKAISYISSIVL